MRRGTQHSRLDMNARMYGPWPLLVAAAHWALLDAGAAEIALCLAVSAGLIAENEFIHEQVHIRGSALAGWRWFDTMRALHFLHHRDGMHHNYAMCDFLYDFLSGNLINMF